MLLFFSCEKKLPEIAPDIITENTLHDTDDPAIWVNPENPEESIVFGTDKETEGAIYAFDLNGKIIENKTIRGLKRPNNVDIRYGFKVNDGIKTDVLAFTERERQQVRLFSIPDMKPLDNGGFKVFEDVQVSVWRDPMGISFYQSPKDSALYLIVGRKTGPLENYLYQYELKSNSLGVSMELKRTFGKFSGKKEIEAIAVDDALGFVYYSDEGHCIRKYYAEPANGNDEVACFGGEYFKDDIEGIAIAAYPGGEGYLIVSNQQKGTFNIFSRKENAFVREVDLSTTETDGCEVVTVPLNGTFRSGLFVAMNDARNFYFYDLAKLGLK